MAGFGMRFNPLDATRGRGLDQPAMSRRQLLIETAMRSRSVLAFLCALFLCGCESDGPVKPPALLPPTWVASWGDSGRAPGPFGFPTGVAVDGRGRVYVANNSYDRVEVIRPDGVHFATWGHGGTGDGEFMNPVSVSVGPDGTVAVGDITGRVQLFDSTGVYLRTLPYPSALVTEAPAFVDIAQTGRILVSYLPSRRIARYSPSGNLESVWPADSSAVQGTLYPCDLAATDDGRVYLADWFGGDVRFATSDGHLIRVLDHFGSGGDQLGGPYGVDVDLQGRVYITDRNANRISVFDDEGHYLLSWGETGSGPGQFQTPGPGGIAVGPEGLIYVTDIGNDRIQVFKWALSE